MSSKTLIREDEDGLYANVGGWKVRPWAWLEPAATEHKVGDHVTASHNGGPLARVGGEQWMIERPSDATLKIEAKYRSPA